MLIPDQKAIEAEIESILNSKYFRYSGLLSRFLKFIVTKTFEGKSNEIKEYTIGVEVLGRPATFKPQQDGSVRIHAVRLRKMLDAYYSEEGKLSPLKIYMPRGGYMPTFIITNSTPVPNERDASINEHERINTGHFKDSICVLPFECHAENDTLNSASIRDGFCAQLSESLSLFEDISVISWVSTTQYLQENCDRRKIGELFKVTYLLTGRIDINVKEIRITVYLGEPSDPMPLWSQVFARDLTGDSYLEIIREIAERIISMLVDYNGYIHVHRYGSRDFKYLPSSSTSLAVFWFYHFLTRNTPEIYFEALGHLKEAIKDDPQCPMSWAVFGHLQTNGFIYGYETGPEQLQLAKQSAEQALELNPESQHGLIALSLIKIIHQQTEEAEELLDKCITINPNSGYFQAGVALGYSMIGNYEKSNALIAKAFRSNPVPIWWLNLPEFMFALHNCNYEKVSNTAPKYNEAAGILENVFELIALYYLGNMPAFRNLAIAHEKKYPGGIAHSNQVLQILFHDPVVKSKINEALRAAIDCP